MFRAMLAVQLSALVVCSVLVVRTNAHGRLVEPPSRSSMWRFGYQTPINYDDNQLFCGGYDVQWHQNGGRCGVCGDPFNGVRQNEAGGRYATGTIARHYTEGQIIAVTLDITTNHGGYFEFRICPNNNPAEPVTELCLNQTLLKQPNGLTRWQIPNGNTGKFSLNLVLPRGLVCSQCVLQWKWNTASNWDCDANNNCCKGCGPQEQFYGCADVAISSSGTSGFQNGFSLGQIANNGNSGSQVAMSGGNNFAFMLTGGAVNTGSNVKCQATAQWKTRYIWADQWCKTQCAAGNCPLQYCQDGCRQLLG